MKNQNEIIDQTHKKLSFNARLLLKELIKRGVKLSPIGSTEYVKADFKGKTEILFDIFTSHIPYPLGILIDDKYYTKQFLTKKGFNVTSGEIFTKETITQSLDYAEKIGYPVVLKPTVGSHGDYIYMDIISKKELRKKLNAFFTHKAGNGFYLIEKQYDATEYRLLITRSGFFAAVCRTPAKIIGDGKKTIKELIKIENYRRMNPRNTCLCEIRIDDITRDFLKKNNLSLSYIPKFKEEVYLRNNSNVSTGGNCKDVTDAAHSSIKNLAKDILASLQVPFIGIDLLCNDIEESLSDYAICELNTGPGLSLHMMPEIGKSRNVAAAIADILFPNTI